MIRKKIVTECCAPGGLELRRLSFLLMLLTKLKNACSGVLWYCI